MPKSIYFVVLLSLLLLPGCPPPHPPVHPDDPVADVPASCDSACKHIGEDGLNCEEGRPTANGAPCQEVCESIPNLSQGYLDCIAAVTACSQISACPR